MKFMRYAQMNLSEILRFPSKENLIQNLTDPMLKYCAMDKRKRKSLDFKLDLVLFEINQAT